MRISPALAALGSLRLSKTITEPAGQVSMALAGDDRTYETQSIGSNLPGQEYNEE